jgi:N-succinyl-L-ornithine transcarbamylase
MYWKHGLKKLKSRKNHSKIKKLGKNKTLGLLFFNSSLRTRLSTQKSSLKFRNDHGDELYQ